VITKAGCQCFFFRRHVKLTSGTCFSNRSFGSACFTCFSISSFFFASTTIFFFSALTVFFLNDFFDDSFYLLIYFFCFLLFITDLISVFFSIFLNQTHQFTLLTSLGLKFLSLVFLFFSNLFLFAFLIF